MRRRFRPHQLAAFSYARAVRHPALFLEMRLGKTLVAIRRIKMYQPLSPQTGLRILVVAPGSAFGGWLDDLEQEGEPAPTLLLGPRAKRVSLLQGGLGRWNLLNKEGHLALPEVADVDWDAVVLDESTFIKNPRAKVTRFFLSNFRDVPHRWILTGTPNPEGELDFWAQMAFLDGHFLRCHNYWDFRSRFFRPDPFGYDWTPKPGTIEAIQRAVGARCMVRSRRDVGMDRVKVRETRTIEFPVKLQRTYRKIEADYATSDNVTTKWAVSRYSWLRQLCGGFLEGDLVWTGKVDALTDLLTGELKRVPAVVWFNFNAELFAVEARLRELGVSCLTLHGGVKPKEREQRRRAFQAGKVRVFLIQQAVAQTGMDLSAADTAIYYSEPTGQLASKQTQDRILSLSKEGPLLILYLVVKNTVDEDVHRLLAAKAIRSQMQLQRALQQAMRARQERRTT